VVATSDPCESIAMRTEGREFEIEQLLEGHAGELKSIGQAAARGEHDKVIDGVAGLVMTLATGNPLVGALVPFARLGVAKAFGNATDAMLRRELATMEKEEERQAFLGQIDEVLAATLGQAVVQLVSVQHHVKDEVLEALGGLRSDFENFRRDFEQRLRTQSESVRVEDLLVQDGGTGVRVRATTLKRVALERVVVTGQGSVGIDLE
jgi:aminopeptidase N